MKQTIIVQCEHRELRTMSARFDVILDHDEKVVAFFVCLGAAPLDAAWLIDVRYQVDVAAPGAADLYGPAGWDVRMLAAWVSAFECGGTLPAPVTAVLTLPDLLERCAGHAAAGAAANG